jgi:K+-transporting ATPase c subunit
MIRLTFQSLLVLVVLGVLTSGLYPLLVTGTAERAFPRQADGSLIERDGRAVGSELIGPPFVNPRHIFGPPSVTTPVPYDGVASTECQAPRVAKFSGLSEETLRGLIRVHSNPRALGLFAEPRVNVADLYMALDASAR